LHLARCTGGACVGRQRSAAAAAERQVRPGLPAAPRASFLVAWLHGRRLGQPV
ncbi:hypothetical protein HK405_001507, partial [Cladochytrium tenue]